MEGVAKAAAVPIVNYGSIMFEEAKAHKLVTNRDEMRKLPAETQRHVQAVAGEKVGKMDSAIIDTHCLIRTPEGYLPGIPMTVLTMIAPHVVVLVEAPPEMIAKRRAKDGTRHRDHDSVEAITEHQHMNRYAAAAMGVISGATVKIVANLDGDLESAVATFLEVFGK